MYSDDFYDDGEAGREELPIAWDSSEPALSFAYISHSGHIQMDDPDGVIPFHDEPVLTEDLSLKDGHLRLAQPGIYYATFALSAPPDMAADAAVLLSLDGREIPTSIYHIMRPTIPGPGVSFTAQAVFETDAPCALCVACSEPLRFTAASQEVIIASLALVRVWHPKA